MCFKFFQGLFFRSNFYPWSPSGIYEKMNFVKVTPLLFIYAPFYLQNAFYTFRNRFWRSKSIFDEIHFFTYPWDGPGVKIWASGRFAAVIPNIRIWHRICSELTFSLSTDVRKVENGCSEWIISYDRVTKDGCSERKHRDVRDKINSVQNRLGYRVLDEGEEVS